MSSFVQQIDFYPRIAQEQSVYHDLLGEYERVIFQSIFTSFGLDFLVQNMDQHGGDVDTIHNVRQMDSDSHMSYKSDKNRKQYEENGKYNSADYHKGGNYREIKHDAREQFQTTGEPIKDAYTGKDIGFHGKTNAISPDKKAELDHIVAAKEIHGDRGRVLSRLSGTDLADTKENLAFTNKSTNASMGAKTVEEYIAKHSELSEDQKFRMRQKDKQARDSYNAKINVAYYTSSTFYKETAKAAGKVGIAMGLRQIVGLYFTEIWCSIRGVFQTHKGDGQTLFDNIGNGIKKGTKNAMLKYKSLLCKFGEGAIGGMLASVTTTLCNIFFTTSKSFVRIIRQSWASLVEATKIMLFNPDNLPFGERFRATAKVVATGASIIVGAAVNEAIAKIPALAALPFELGDIISVFLGSFTTGIMSCSLLYILDKSESINKLVVALNDIPTTEDAVRYHQIQAALLQEYGAKLMDINIEQFIKESNVILDATSELSSIEDQTEMNIILKKIYATLNFKTPYSDYSDFDSFMCDKDNKLVFA